MSMLHRRSRRGVHRSSAARSSRNSPKLKLATAVCGALLAGGSAFAATNWLVGLSAGSNGEAQSATVANLTISAVASPSASNVLYPGGTGDVVLTIANPNPYPVTVTAVNLPTNTTYAAGYTTSALTSAQAGCTTATSDVSWNYATASTGSSHALASAGSQWQLAASRTTRSRSLSPMTPP